MRWILNRLKHVEDLDDEVFFSHLLPVLCQRGTGQKGPHLELKPDAVDRACGIGACRKVNAVVRDVFDLHDPHGPDAVFVFLDDFPAIHRTF
jgi:hypothetical protein